MRARFLVLLLAVALGCARSNGSTSATDATTVGSAPTSMPSPRPNLATLTTSPSTSSSASSTGAPRDCAPRIPPEYTGWSLGEPLSLREGWRARLGTAKGASAVSFDDAGWSAFTAPGKLLLPVTERREKTNVAWLRRKLTIDAPRAGQPLFLDLGGRPGDSRIFLDGTLLHRAENGAPVFVELPKLAAGEHVLAIELGYGKHVGGIRWWGDAAIGTRTSAAAGAIFSRTFASKVDGSTQPITVRVPRCVEKGSKMPLLVALPGWSGNEWSFAHSRMLDEADRRGWLVMTPNPRGNRLYTGAAEQGVLEAIDVVRADFPVDDDRISITGVSMGGAGALQIAYHYPDRFASVAAFYGDSKYDLSTYVSKILVHETTAARYSVLEFPQNARNFPVLLIHAKDDDVSGFEQSRWLFDADQKLGLSDHRLIAPATGGHTLQLVEDHVDALVTLFAAAKRNSRPAQVSFKTSSSSYHQAYWLDVHVRSEGTFAEVDASYDDKTHTLQLHRVDPGVDTLRVDVAALGLHAGSLSLVLERDTQAKIVFVGGNLTGAPPASTGWKKGTYALAITNEP